MKLVDIDSSIAKVPQDADGKHGHVGSGVEVTSPLEGTVRGGCSESLESPVQRGGTTIGN